MWDPGDEEWGWPFAIPAAIAAFVGVLVYAYSRPGAYLGPGVVFFLVFAAGAGAVAGFVGFLVGGVLSYPIWALTKIVVPVCRCAMDALEAIVVRIRAYRDAAQRRGGRRRLLAEQIKRWEDEGFDVSELKRNM